MRFPGYMMSMSLLAILIISLIPASQGECGTYDDDTSLEFYWTAATGNVHHYNVHLSIDDGDYSLVGSTSTAPASDARTAYL